MKLKAIISHDVDHLTVWEHVNDLVIPKFLLRYNVEFVLGSISAHEYLSIIVDFYKNKWQNLDELMDFDRQNQIPSTFFLGVSNGLGLSYSLKNADRWINNIKKRGFQVGVHGINFNDPVKIRKEFDEFSSASGLEIFGVRTHYLRLAENTLDLFENVGYSFDTSSYGLCSPYKIGQMIEFPLHIMDTRVMYSQGRYRITNLSQAQDYTKRIIDNVSDLNLSYLTILFHDRYFCSGFQRWKNWYKWLVEYLHSNGLEFINYESAVSEILGTEAV